MTEILPAYETWVALLGTSFGLLFLSAGFAAVGRMWRGRPALLAAVAAVAASAVVAQLFMLRESGSEGPIPPLARVSGSVVSWLVEAFALDPRFLDPLRYLGPTIFNLSLGLLAVPLATGTALLWERIIAPGGRAAADEPQAAEGIADRLLGGTLLAGIYRTLCLTGAAAGVFLAGWQCVLSERLFLRDSVDACGRAIWIAPFAIFALLWRGAGPKTAGEREPDRATAQKPGGPPSPDLGALFASYTRDFGPHLLVAKAGRTPFDPPRAKPPGPRPSSEAADRIASAAERIGVAGGRALRGTLGPVLEGIWGGRDGLGIRDRQRARSLARLALMVDEDITYLHFLVFAELILTAQDRGTTALVVAPEASVDRIGDAIAGALAAFEGGPTHRIFRAGEQLSGEYDSVVISLQRLEAELLSSREPSLIEVRRRCGLLLVLDLHRMDATLLRLRLLRLSRTIDDRRPLALVQSAPRSGLDAQVLAVLAPLGVDTTRPLSLGGDDAACVHRLVWRNDAEALRELLREDLDLAALPDEVVELAPFTLVRAWTRGIRATFFDLAGRMDRTLWLRALPKLLPQGSMRAQETGIAISDLENGRIAYPTRDDRVVVIEDLANLVEAVSRSVNFMNNPETLVHIVAHDYPMRDFLAQILGEDEREGRPGSTFLPIAPSPRGGPVELALSLADEILRAPDRRVPERVLMRCFTEADAGERLPRDTWADTTRRGLRELLKAQLGYAPDISAEASPGHERQMRFTATMPLRLEPTYLLDVRSEAVSDSHTVQLDRNDWGTTYIEGSVLQVRGTFLSITRVDPTMVHGSPTDPPGRLARSSAHNRLRFSFSRLYHPELLDKSVALLDRRVSADARPVQSLVLLLRGPLTRRTVSFHSTAELERPFAAGHQPDWKEQSAQRSMPQAMQMLLRFRLGGADAASPDASSESQETAGASTPPMAAALRAARCAFTLATTLQDVLWSVFPGNGERLAVLSPQAHAAVEHVLRNRNGRHDLDSFEIYPAVLMPRLVDGSILKASVSTGRPSTRGGLLRLPAEEGAATAWVSDMIFNHRHDAEGEEILSDSAVDRFAGDGRFLDLLVVEDASHDLGCLRALFKEASHQTVMTIWHRYLCWCVDQAGAGGFYYRYGIKQDRLPEIFDFTGAAEILGRLIVGADGVS